MRHPLLALVLLAGGSFEERCTEEGQVQRQAADDQQEGGQPVPASHVRRGCRHRVGRESSSGDPIGTPSPPASLGLTRCGMPSARATACTGWAARPRPTRGEPRERSAVAGAALAEISRASLKDFR